MRVKFWTLIVMTAVSLTFSGCGSGGSSSGGGNKTLTSISVTPGSASIPAGLTQQYKAQGSYSDGTSGDITSSVTWSSSSTNIATINGSGLATAVAAGSTTITATSGSVSGSTTLTVTTPKLTAITVSPIGPAVKVSGGTLQFTATGVLDNNATQDMTSKVNWTSTDTSAATIASGGLATAGSTAGVTTITATDPSSGVAGTTALNVTAQSLGNSTLSGAYVFTVSFDQSGVTSRPQYVAGLLNANGAGGLTGSLDYNTSSGTSSTGPVSISAGSYSVFPDGRGTATITSSLGTVNFRFVLNTAGSKAQIIAWDNHGTLSPAAEGTLEKQTATTLSGTYVFGFGGVQVSTNDNLSQAGLFTVSGNTISITSEDQNLNGTASSPAVQNGTVSVGSNGQGTASIGTLKYGVYVVSASKAYFIETDAGATALLGQAQLQSAGPFSNTSVSGGFVYLMEDGSHSTFEIVGQLSFNNGTGRVGGEFDEDIGTGSTLVQLNSGMSGNYSIAANGRGTFSSLTGAKGPRNFIFYMISNSKMMTLQIPASTPFATLDAHASLGLGEAQTIAPLASGLYLFRFSENEPAGDQWGLQGQLNFSGSSVIGIQDTNHTGALSAYKVSGSIASADASGRAIMSVTGNQSGQKYVVYIVNSTKAAVAGQESASPSPVPDVDGYIEQQ